MASGTEGEMKKMSIREITEEIGKVYEMMKSIVDEAQSEGEPMAQEKEEQYSRMNARLTDLIKMRDQHYRLLDAQAAASRAMDRKVEAASETRTDGKRGASLREFVGSEEYRSAFSKYLRLGLGELNPSEQRAMTEGTDANGGYLPATEFLSSLVEARWQANAMRQIANVIPLGTFETEVVYENAFPTAAYASEAADFSSSESNPTFDQIILKPHTMRVFTKVSNELLADAPSRGPAFNVESILSRQFGRVMGELEESKFCTGTGSGQPKGIFAFTATRTITAVETATKGVVVASDLQNVIASLPRAYRANAKWVMSDEMFWKIRAFLQVGTAGTAAGGNYAPYAWSLGDGRLLDGEPDRLLGFPVVCCNGGPAFANGAITAVFGNFDYFHIGEREGVSIKVARERYLETNQTGYFAFARHGSDVSLLNAFRYLKIKST
jgi:HK97 family phage major capsid protein